MIFKRKVMIEKKKEKFLTYYCKWAKPYECGHWAPLEDHNTTRFRVFFRSWRFLSIMFLASVRPLQSKCRHLTVFIRKIIKSFYIKEKRSKNFQINSNNLFTLANYKVNIKLLIIFFKLFNFYLCRLLRRPQFICCFYIINC